MIVKAFMAIISSLTSFIFSILPSFPVLPSFIGDSLSFMSSIMINGAGIVRYLLGDLVYLATLDYIVILINFNLFIQLFKFIKKYVLLK